MNKKVGIAGIGAIGRRVAEELLAGIEGYTLHAIAELGPVPDLGVPRLSLEDLAKECDLIIECLPAAAVPELAKHVFDNNKDMIVISSAALIAYPEILKQKRISDSRIYVPEGAIIGVMKVQSLAHKGIVSAKIVSTKRPQLYAGAPYVIERKIDLSSIKTLTNIFIGNAFESSRGFPANTNVAATLSLYSGLGPEKTMVEVWADPDATVNTHEITAISKDGETVHFKVESKPDPKNPKTSSSTPLSIINVLNGQQVLTL